MSTVLTTITPLPLLDGDTLMIDNSGLEGFQTCPRQGQYSLCFRRRTSGDRAALKFGGIMHKVLEPRYRSKEPMYAQTEAVQGVMVGVAQTEFTKYIPPEEEYRTFDRMVALIAKYGEVYPFEPFEVMRLPDGRPFVELPCALPLGEIHVNADMVIQDMVHTSEGRLVKRGVPYTRSLKTLKILWMVRLDLVYEYSNGVYLMDHKSSSMATNMAEFEIAHQFYGYKWAIEKVLRRRVTGVTINRIVVRKPTRTGESFTMERKLIAFQDGLAREWQDDILHIASDFVEMVRRQYLPKHTAWCVGKYGTCQFHKVCSLDTNEQREMMLYSGEFEENTWSPLMEEV